MARQHRNASPPSSANAGAIAEKLATESPKNTNRRGHDRAAHAAAPAVLLVMHDILYNHRESIFSSCECLQMFYDSPTYRQANSDAHRARSTNIRTPALTWHTAFWIPNRREDSDYNRRRVKDKLDAIAIRLYVYLKQIQNPGHINLKPQIQGFAVLFNRVVDLTPNATSLRPIRRAQCNYRQQDILDGDRRFVTLEFAWERFWITMRSEILDEYFTVTVIAEVLGSYLQNIDQLKNSEPRVNIDKNYDGKLFIDLYHNKWEIFTEFLFSIPGARKHFESDIFHHVFADFRGIIIGNETLNFDTCRFDDKKVKPDWAPTIIEQFRGPLTTENRYECTASYMLDGRALYMTSLGPQVPDHPLNDRVPLTFVLCVRRHDPEDPTQKVVNRWQLGRLVSRINALGTMRLAALRNLRLLRRAGTQLSEIDGTVKSARDAVERYSTNSRESVPSLLALEQAHARLNAISGEFIEDEDNDNKVGLSYRIERSRYYVSQFRSNIGSLRLVRIEGYQRYDQFVERRMGPTFDFIDRLGIRYERAIAAIGSLDQSYVAARSARTGASVEGIQRWGEILLIVVLVPYYVLGTLHHLVKEGKLFIIVSALFISATTVLAIIKFARFHRPTDYRTKLVKGLLIGLLYVFFLIMVSLYLRVADQGDGHDRQQQNHRQSDAVTKPH